MDEMFETADTVNPQTVCEHEWPDHLDASARCHLCGLAYGEWSEVP